MPGSKDLPSTLERSPKHAQEIWVKAHDSAIEEYGRGRRAQQTAYAALKHQYEKVGDHWVEKGHKGPSDAGAKRRGRPTAGGVDANASKSHLMDVARQLDVKGRSRMTKPQLVKAIQSANDKATRKARN
ncbi:ChaB family protein [Gryllotalpicola protaetiae]|uniref:Cation transport regulator ChaB n=1 Tax=Gryllotalpicola protaetiae TaxID=2419771 RepID=A0A387BTK8_9MICO|nr:ChaB family protein [Gryllotalpicola protaetiae]AYG04376.1 cation transport regulator ChaB [Gryllotalpicola protaetiae]